MLEHAKHFGRLLEAGSSDQFEEEGQAVEAQETKVAHDLGPLDDSARPSPRTTQLSTLVEEQSGQDVQPVRLRATSAVSLAPSQASADHSNGLISRILSHGTDDAATPRPSQRNSYFHTDEPEHVSAPPTHKKIHRISRVLKNAFH